MSATGLSDNLRGAGLMVFAMAAFALEDVGLKTAATTMPVGQILMLFGVAGTLGFVALAWMTGQPIWHPAMASQIVLLRATGEVGGRVGYTLAVALTPLATATAILQATPLMVVAGAALFMGEHVGWRRWSAICIGFAGVLLILRPGMEGFQPASMFAVLGMVSLAARDLATRAAPRALGTLQLGICGFVVLGPTGAVMLLVTGGAVWPNASDLALIGMITFVGIIAYSAITAAMRVGSISVVSPFRYSRLPFGICLGVLIFAEKPDALTLWGSVIILTTGIYILLRTGGSETAHSGGFDA